MRILWMKPILPYPPRQGTSRVTLQLLRNLSGEHVIHLFAPYRGRGEFARARSLEEDVPGLRVRGMLAPNRRSPLHRAWYRLATRSRTEDGIPPIEAYIAMPELRRRFRALAEEIRPELTVVEYWYAAAYLDEVPGAPGVLFAHDLEYLLRSGAGAKARDAVRADRYAAIEIARERAALAAAPSVWFLTDADRDRAAAECGVPPARSAVMPFGIDTETAFAPRRPGDPEETPGTVLFFGSFAADFNRDALAFVLDAIWPELRRRVPAARLRIAGGGLSEPWIRRCREAGAEVLGEVGDVRGLLLASQVLLIPLRFGGGLRIRLLEALALERAVVGTPIGVLGMGPAAGREVLAAESAEDLAGAAARLLLDEDLRRELGGRGRRWVEAARSLPQAAERQRELVRRFGRGGAKRAL